MNHPHQTENRDLYGGALPPSHTRPTLTWIKVVGFRCMYCGAVLQPTTPEEEAELLRVTPCCAALDAAPLLDPIDIWVRDASSEI